MLDELLYDAFVQIPSFARSYSDSLSRLFRAAFSPFHHSPLILEGFCMLIPIQMTEIMGLASLRSWSVLDFSILPSI
jgi:hypothetical protein